MKKNNHSTVGIFGTGLAQVFFAENLIVRLIFISKTAKVLVFLQYIFELVWSKMQHLQQFKGAAIFSESVKSRLII